MSGQEDLLHILKERKAMEEKSADGTRLWGDALMADIPVHQTDLAAVTPQKAVQQEPATNVQLTNALDDLTGGKFSEIFGSI